jgi:glutaconate CoA-transferase subunit A
MPKSKLMTAKEAVAEYVHDSDIIYFGFGSTFCPHALGYEVLRQGKKDLDIIGGTPGSLQHLLIYTGLATRARAGGGMAMREGNKPGIAWQRAEEGTFHFEDYTNLSTTLMLMAGALGIPFIPARTVLGTSFLEPENIAHAHGFLGENKLKVIQDPYSGKPLVALPAVRPGVALYHVQRADENGNAQAWGVYGDAKWGLWASERVIISAEEIVPTEVVRSDPNRTLLPGVRVSAVVHIPYGCFPGELPGYYASDGSMMRFNSTNLDDFLEEWVHGCPDHEAFMQHYVEKFGFHWLEGFKPKVKAQPIGTVDYGYRPIHDM